ncbi:hypothetical protein EV178_006417 [Coemansia sp. RSA 1646]|nr:hypothetical protein EV178_006417 [Coemansia sp. RSA 1646]
MNLSGLSYLQFSLVDGFVLVYLFLRVHMVHGWSEINPISVLRLSPRNRGSGLVTLLGFYSCVAASALFLAKDAIMAGQELDDVALCRTAVYVQQKVTPLDTQQLSGVKAGLVLWNVASGLQLLALGCVMCNWASATVQQMLGSSTLMRPATGKGLLGLGALGLIGAIVSHAAAFHTYGDNTARARSVARIVGTAFFIVFLGVLAWTTGCVSRILRHAVARDPAATASLVHATYINDNGGGYPMATMQYLLGMQMLAFMRDTAVNLCVLLFLRGLFFMAFDISYLTPQQLAVSNLAENNVFTGIGTLAASLISAVVVQTLFPIRQHVVGAVLAKASEELEDDPSARLAFIDGQHPSIGGGRRSHGMIPVPKLAASLASRNHSLSNGGGDTTLRSRAPTTASLAVEKATGAVWNSSSRQLNNSVPAIPPPSSLGNEKPPFGDFSTADYMATGDSTRQNTNYLDQIPYIDRTDRENSFFSQGPWTHPVTRTLSPHPLSETATMDRTNSSNSSVPQTASNGIINSNPFAHSQKTSQQQLDEHVPNSSFIFSDEEDDDDRPRTSRAQQTDSAFIPLSSSNVALNSSNVALSRSTVMLTQRDPADRSGSGSNDLTASIGSNMTRPSNGQSLHAEALMDAPMSPTVAMPTDSDQRTDSIVSSYIRADNSGGLPVIRRLFVDDHRPPSFVSADYQYEPGESGSIRPTPTASPPNNPFEDAMGSPMQLENNRSNVPSVYVADAATQHDTRADADAEDFLDSRDLTTPGPILIRKGSKASVRRKGTVERRRRLADGSAQDRHQKTVDSSTERMADAGSGDSSLRSSTDGNTAGGMASSNNSSGNSDPPEKMSQRVSRMSAFSGAPIKLAALLGKASNTNKDRKALAPADSKRPGTAGSGVTPPPDDMKRDSSTISNIAWDQTHSKHASEVSATAGPFAPDPHGHHNHQFRRLSRDLPPHAAESGASLPSSLFKNSVSSIGSRTSNDVFASFASIHTTGGGDDSFYTPEASLAQINNSDQNHREAADSWKHQTSDSDILAMPVARTTASEERPSTAPTSASSGYRHTMEATSREPASAQQIDDDDDANVHGLSTSSGAKRSSIRMRRAQTLRKAVDTDALAIERSLHASENDESTDVLISALPMPEPSSLGGGIHRVIL